MLHNVHVVTTVSTLLLSSGIASADPSTSSTEGALGRRFCRTRSAYVGLAPEDAQPGDVVYALYGGRVPFVLRRNEREKGAFQLVGPSYIHGIMKGEALEMNSFLDEMVRIH